MSEQMLRLPRKQCQSAQSICVSTPAARPPATPMKTTAYRSSYRRSNRLKARSRFAGWFRRDEYAIRCRCHSGLRTHSTDLGRTDNLETGHPLWTGRATGLEVESVLGPCSLNLDVNGRKHPGQLLNASVKEP